MGQWATAKRAAIVSTFESGSGDMRGDVEPVFIWRRPDDMAHAVELDKTVDGTTMRLSYRIVDAKLDDDDVARLFAIAYLDEFTDHYYRDKAASIVLTNAATGAVRSFAYPDA